MSKSNTNRRRKTRTKIIVGSDNVFADLGLPDAEEHFLKAQLVANIDGTLRARKLTRIKASRLLDVAPSRLAAILRGQFREVSVDRLLRFLLALDLRVGVVVRPRLKTPFRSA